MTPLKAIVVLALIALASCQSGTPSAAPPPSSSLAPGDARLRSEVYGVWLSEQIGNTTTHVASRTQYSADGSFVADYRISHPGSATCFREKGHWEITDGMFLEEAKQTTNPEGRMTPKLYRRIVSAKSDSLTLESRTGMKAVLFRGPGTPAKNPPPLNERGLLEDLHTRKMRGFVPTPIPNQPGKVAWTLESPSVGKLNG